MDDWKASKMVLIIDKIFAKVKSLHMNIEISISTLSSRTKQGRAIYIFSEP